MFSSFNNGVINVKPETKTETESSDKTMKRVYNPDDDDHILKPKAKTGTRPKAKIETN